VGSLKSQKWQTAVLTFYLSPKTSSSGLDVLGPNTEAERSALRSASAEQQSTIYVVDDDCLVRDGIRELLQPMGLAVEDFGNCETFLEAYTPGKDGCLLLDACLPGMSGLELLQTFQRDGNKMPTVMITGRGDIAMAVEAMKAGASDFLEKPVTRRRLMECVEVAVKTSQRLNLREGEHKATAAHLAELTPRQTEIMALVLAGHPNKNIAADLCISQRTVENHRASVMRKLGTKSLPELARFVMSAEINAAS
jgi:two-component system, chemotaxis family, CheB/CheR fusion protein